MNGSRDSGGFSLSPAHGFAIRWTFQPVAFVSDGDGSCSDLMLGRIPVVIT